LRRHPNVIILSNTISTKILYSQGINSINNKYDNMIFYLSGEIMAEDIIEGVNPTRMDLLEMRKKKKLADKGHKLLTEKRDALISSFMDILKKRKEIRSGFIDRLNLAYKSYDRSEALMGTTLLSTISTNITPIENLKVKTENVMGVRIPHFTFDPPENKINYSMIDSSAIVDETVMRFRKITEDLIRIAEIEGAVEMLASEIEKTKRRVNALEYIFVPRLQHTLKFIERSLEEREREEFFRRKRIKQIMGE